MSGITARNLLRDMLETNVLDPYPTIRTGNQFFTDADGVNLHRANTFPKGYVFLDERPPSEKTTFHQTGWSQEKQRVLIHYFVKDKISYTDASGTVYKDREYAAYMREQIKQTIQDNPSLGSSYYVANVEESSNAVRELESPNSAFKLYEVVIPVTVKWKRQYG